MHEIYSIGVGAEPRKGPRTVTIGMAIPLTDAADPALWAATMEAVRLDIVASARVAKARAEKPERVAR